MRMVLIAMVAAAGLGLAGTAPSFAAPASGAALLNGTASIDNVEKAKVCTRWRCNRWGRCFRRCWY